MGVVNVALASGGDPVKVEVGEGTTVSDALGRSGVQARPGDQLLLRGKPVNLGHPVRSGDLLIVAPPVEHG